MTNPDRCCDLVMKGGITSGVVYPRVVEEVAKRFYLMGITGTSAGAIAAALTAAAEYRRRHSPDADDFSGFERLGELGNELGEEGKLLELFTPDKSTRKLFKNALKAKEKGFRAAFSKLRLLSRALRLNKNLSRVTDNGFGLCSGMANGNRKDGVVPLTEWLHERIQEISGKPADQPLTFQDLHEAPVPEVLRPLLSEDRPNRSIDLRAMTSCLTFSRPYELPFRKNTFAFDPDEFRRLFPAAVVNAMVGHAEELRAARAEQGKKKSSRDRDGKLPLVSEKMPILVATRMSLSFPVLLSMVPLWAVDYRLDGDPLQRAWFSDGGITSNFPMHRFDALYPQWPTLGITLAYTGESDKPRRPSLDDGELIYMPATRSANRKPMWNYFDNRDKGLGKLLGFGGAIFNTAKNWHDEIYLGLSPFQDRSVEIWMKSSEGGLNLNMPPEVVRALTARGGVAGERIATRFADDPDDSMSWDGHRWTRFRSGMAALWDTLRELRHAVEAPPMAGRGPLSAWLDGSARPPAHRHGSVDQRKTDEEALGDLFDLLAKYDDRPEQPFDEAPSPRLDLGVDPPF